MSTNNNNNNQLNSNVTPQLKTNKLIINTPFNAISSVKKTNIKNTKSKRKNSYEEQLKLQGSQKNVFKIPGVTEENEANIIDINENHSGESEGEEFDFKTIANQYIYRTETKKKKKLNEDTKENSSFISVQHSKSQINNQNKSNINKKNQMLEENSEEENDSNAVKSRNSKQEDQQQKNQVFCQIAISMKQFYQKWGNEVEKENILQFYESFFEIIYDSCFIEGITTNIGMQMLLELVAKMFKFYYKFIQQNLNVNTMIHKFLSESESHLIIAFKLLSAIFQEMSYFDPLDYSIPIEKQKNNVQSFRESGVLQLINLPYEFFQQELSKVSNCEQDYTELVITSANLLRDTLVFNYNGINTSDPDDEFLQFKAPLLLPSRLKKEQQPICYSIIKSYEFSELLFSFLNTSTQVEEPGLYQAILQVIGALGRINIKFFNTLKNDNLHIEYLKGIFELFNKHMDNYKQYILSCPEILKGFLNTLISVFYNVQFQYLEDKQPVIEQFLYLVNDLHSDIIQNPLISVDIQMLAFEFWDYFTYFRNRNFLMADQANEYIESLVQKYIEAKMDLVDVLDNSNLKNQFQYIHLQEEFIDDPLYDLSEIKLYTKFMGHFTHANIDKIQEDLFFKFQQECQTYITYKSLVSLKKAVWLGYSMLYTVYGFIDECEKMTDLANQRGESVKNSKYFKDKFDSKKASPHLNINDIQQSIEDMKPVYSTDTSLYYSGKLIGAVIKFAQECRVENFRDLNQKDFKILENFAIQTLYKISKLFFKKKSGNFQYEQIFDGLIDYLEISNKSQFLTIVLENVIHVFQNSIYDSYEKAIKILNIISDNIEITYEFGEFYVLVGQINLQEQILVKLYQPHADNNYEILKDEGKLRYLGQYQY